MLLALAILISEPDKNVLAIPGVVKNGQDNDKEINHDDEKKQVELGNEKKTYDDEDDMKKRLQEDTGLHYLLFFNSDVLSQNIKSLWKKN